MTPQPKVLFILECTHVMHGPANSERVLCYECRADRRATDIHIYEWKAECKTCHWARWAGLSRHLATYMANAHARVKNHEVIAPYRANPVAARVQEKMFHNRVI